MSQEDLCQSRVTVKKPVPGKDASGGRVNAATWTTVATDVAADIQPASSQTLRRYDQQNMQVTYTIFMVADLHPLAGWRIEDDDGRIYKVQGGRPPAKGYDEWPAVADVLEELTA